MSKKERRQAPRIILKAAYVYVSLDPNSQEKHKEKICDISELGASLVSLRPYLKNSVIYLSFLLPCTSSHLIDIPGKVVWCKKKENSYHVGIEFEKDPVKQPLVKEYIKIIKMWEKADKHLTASEILDL